MDEGAYQISAFLVLSVVYYSVYRSYTNSDEAEKLSIGFNQTDFINTNATKLRKYDITNLIEYPALTHNPFDDLKYSVTPFSMDKPHTSKDVVSYLRFKCSTSYKSYREQLCSIPTNFNKSFIPDKSQLPVDCNDHLSHNAVHDRFSWLVDSKRKLAFCLPPKSGCSTVNFIWHALKKNSTNWLRNENKKLINIYKKVPHLTNNHFEQGFYLIPWRRVINLRHPFERLYSGFRSKMTIKNNGWMKKACHWSQKFVREDDQYGGPEYCVSFEAFLTFIVSNRQSNIERHFRPTSSICNPCEIDFTDVTEKA